MLLCLHTFVRKLKVCIPHTCLCFFINDSHERMLCHSVTSIIYDTIDVAATVNERMFNHNYIYIEHMGEA